MSQTVHNSMHADPRGRARRARVLAGAVTVVLVAATLLVMWGCADKRTPPSAPADLGYEQTIVLWDNVATGTNTVSAAFDVPQDLAPIVNPGVDTPARLNVWCIVPVDDQMLRRETIVGGLLPALGTDMLNLQIDMSARASHLDSLLKDSIRCAHRPDSCRLSFLDSLYQERDSTIAHLRADTAQMNGDASDTTRLGRERDSLATVLDGRYVLSLRFDNDTTIVYPNAVFRDAAFSLSGQGIGLVQTDPASHTKGKQFSLAMDRFQAADAHNLGRSLTVNWTTCFAGSNRPCMSTGPHTLYARLTGASARISGTIVVVYRDRRQQ
jgi:hypothetical protein